MSSAEPHNTEDTEYYTAFDVTSYGITSTVPRIYKKITMKHLFDPGVGSQPNTYKNKVTETITTFPLYTVIIAMDKGVITAITYDDGCFFCPSNGPMCMSNAYNATSGGDTEVGGQYIGCGTEMATCYPSLGSSTELDAMYLNTTIVSSASTIYSNVTNVTCTDFDSQSNCLNSTNTTELIAVDLPGVNTTQWVYNASLPLPVARNSTISAAVLADTAAACDLKIFVVWTGTDASGNYLKSANKRFSRFRQFSVSTAYQSALNLGQNAVDLGKTSMAIAENIPGAVARSD